MAPKAVKMFFFCERSANICFGAVKGLKECFATRSAPSCSVAMQACVDELMFGATIASVCRHWAIHKKHMPVAYQLHQHETSDKCLLSHSLLLVSTNVWAIVLNLSSWGEGCCIATPQAHPAHPREAPSKTHRFTKSEFVQPKSVLRMTFRQQSTETV